MTIFIYSNIAHAENMYLRVPSFSQSQGTRNISKKSPEYSLETKKSLHIGCGGANSILIPQDVDIGFKVTVIDISEPAIEFQKGIDSGYSESGNELPTYICVDASSLDTMHGFENNSYDKITILNVFDGLKGGEYIEIIDNILNLIVEGGIIVATTQGDVYAEADLLLEQANERKIDIKKISDSIDGKHAFYKVLKKPKKVTGYYRGDTKRSL